ncbi:MAG: bacteriophage holin [Bacteroidales bacterium]|nr:bacteriophage holin [Bacteroidales bacterium]
MKLDIKAMALTFAIFFGLGLFLLTWWVILFDGASTEPNMVSTLYRGYSFSPLGSFIGLAWAFADGAVGGTCIAWVYNMLIDKKQNS